MLKKFIAVMAIFSLVNVSAAVPQQNLVRAIQEFNFSITVDWNQTDSAFYNAAVQKFRKDIAELSASGMSNEEIVTGVLKNIKDDKIVSEITSMLLVVDTKEMNKEEAISFIVDLVRSNSVNGAHFNGNRRRNLLMAGLIVGIAIALVLVFCDDEDQDDEVIIEEEEEEQECYEWYYGEDKIVDEYCYYDEQPV